MIDAYIIHLSHAKERKREMQQRIEALGEQTLIRFHFYEAIEARGERFLSYQKHWDWDMLTKLYRGKKLSDGEKACFASHYSLWEQCANSEKNLLVFEDDVVFLEGFLQQIQKILNKHVDFVRLMFFFEKKMFDFDEDLFLTYENICGTQGYFISPKAARAFLRSSKLWLCPVDNFLDKSYLHSIPNLISNPPVIKECGIDSCIGKKGRDEKPCFLWIISREVCASLEFLWRKAYEYIQRF